jgi:hypothetical protein
MAKLYRFEITKAALEALPPRELGILIGGGADRRRSRDDDMDAVRGRFFS